MIKFFWKRFLFLAILLVSFYSFQGSKAAPLSQQSDPAESAKLLLNTLTPEERVGQLFLVTFSGPEAAQGTPNSDQIYDLIVNYHIGGVILQTSNNNFVGADRTITILQSLTDQLQRDEYAGSLKLQLQPEMDQTFRPAFVPLLIGVAQNGDGYPYDQILGGVTQLPSQMALGATWQPELARQLGIVLGRELSILGINLFLGPSLDVLESQFSEGNNDLGVRTFGGDPFWVAEMGEAYVSGLHEGSNDKLVVVGKHFPGYGGSDRLPEEEVATVRKTLEQLKQFELYPFFALTGNALSPEATLDALLVSHIRYQGFQENFRATTRPVSFDPQAFANLMSLPALKSWREQGGIMISDSLGSRAVRRFYDPTGQTFNGRSVALDAFLAGNDMLYLGNFVSSGDTSSYTTTLRTLGSFTLKYREDPAFAQRVDEAALRILTLKYRLYDGSFNLSKTLPLGNQVNELGTSSQLTFEAARQAATLISPSISELDETIPGLNDRIVIVSDSRVYQQCSQCEEHYTVQIDALEQAILRLYSPQAGGQILPRNLASHTFSEVLDMLDNNNLTAKSDAETNLIQADWIVFLMLDINPNIPSSMALRRFLDERPDLIQGKRIIVFSLNAPYYLGATEISKLTAYYGLYGKSSPFIEVAARLLFQEIQPGGSLPVSVPGVGYDLNTITFPAPDQTIIISLDIPIDEASVDATPTAVTTTPTSPQFHIGDLIPVTTNVIVDHNGHMVPDNTIVRFIAAYEDSAVTKTFESQTIQGVAKTVVRVDLSGNMKIRVESEPAKNSTILEFAIPVENPTATEPATATPMPTETPMPTLTATVTPTLDITPTETPPPLPRINLGHWFTSIFIAGAIAVITLLIAVLIGQTRWGVRGGLLALIGGLLAYSYMVLNASSTTKLLSQIGSWAVIVPTALGALVGIVAALIWQTQARR